MRKHSISIRRHTYRGEQGFLICGRARPNSYGVSIFTTSRDSAERIKRKVLDGKDVTSEDFKPAETGALTWLRPAP